MSKFILQDVKIISRPNICNISGRSVSVYTDTSAFHEYLCTLIQNGHEYCIYLSNDLKQSCFQSMPRKINVKSLKNCEKVSVNHGRSLSVYTDTD